MPLLPMWIADDAPPASFPDPESALDEPNGLLAVGGDLSLERLLYAYRRGIFPWFSEGQPVLWWSPEPRAVLYPDRLKLSRSLRKTIRSGRFEVRCNRRFLDVMRECAAPRRGQGGTWIVDSMLEAYARLHAAGWAHSVEVYAGDELVGGLYGVSMGQVFFGESMFSRMSDASKVALNALCHCGFEMIDCQVPSQHLISLGAEMVSRRNFNRLLERYCEAQPAVRIGRGTFEPAPDLDSRDLDDRDLDDRDLDGRNLDGRFRHGTACRGPETES